LKIIGKTKPLHHWENENKLRLEIKKALDRENIKIAHSKIEVVKEVSDGKEL
jgi:small-conductance mechanosensitive channel